MIHFLSSRYDVESQSTMNIPSKMWENIQNYCRGMPSALMISLTVLNHLQITEGTLNTDDAPPKC